MASWKAAAGRSCLVCSMIFSDTLVPTYWALPNPNEDSSPMLMLLLLLSRLSCSFCVPTRLSRPPRACPPPLNLMPVIARPTVGQPSRSIGNWLLINSTTAAANHLPPTHRSQSHLTKALTKNSFSCRRRGRAAWASLDHLALTLQKHGCHRSYSTEKTVLLKIGKDLHSMQCIPNWSNWKFIFG